ncbi:dienelactone hydrolase family protein [Alteromonadaceae bacterium BrNp21-10]|nr:dienelactone hydrolase family protein [Alteromonadaceae bacterium BrNp21-10]
MKKWAIAVVVLSTFLLGCAQTISSVPSSEPSSEQLIRESYVSVADNAKREYFVYLPQGYADDANKHWPVLMFLHGNGERGNGLDELDFVKTHGALYEAWVQKKPLPFIIIAPQLHMFGMDQKGIGYIDNRDIANVPQRQVQGTPAREALYGSDQAMSGSPQAQTLGSIPPDGWERVEQDLLGMLDTVQQNYRGDVNRTYLSGLSYGGFGTWSLASHNPQKFAAIAPVVGWGHPDLMDSIAQHKLPVWAFAGGRDNSVKVEYFYQGLNKLEQLGHKVRFTTHEDMGHDTWKRVYASDDLYHWLLSHQLSDRLATTDE